MLVLMTISTYLYSKYLAECQSDLGHRETGAVALQQVRRQSLAQRNGQHRLRGIGRLEEGHLAEGQRGQSADVGVPMAKLVEPEAVDEMPPVSVGRPGFLVSSSFRFFDTVRVSSII